MLTPLTLLVLAAAPIKLAAPGFTLVGVDPKLAEICVERFFNIIGQQTDFKVTSDKDIAQVLGYERQKQLLSCSEAAGSCVAELAGALGADAIITGSIARVGTSFTTNLRVLRASDGSQLALATGRVPSEQALQDWLDGQAAELPAKIRAALGGRDAPGAAAAPPTAEVATGSATMPTVVRMIPAIAGGASLITGAVLFGLSKSDASTLRTGHLSDPAQIDATASSGQLKETAGLALMATGGVLVAASVVWAVVGGSSDVHVAAAPSPNGFSIGVTGELP